MEVMTQESKQKTCTCVHHKTGPALIIIIGIVLILSAFVTISLRIQALVYGVCIIVLGVTRIKGRTCGCCNKA